MKIISEPATRLDESWTNWSAPENMGPIVNGTMDDEFFLITHCKRFAFFSKQTSIHNTDLFRLPISELYNTPEDAKGSLISSLLKL